MSDNFAPVHHQVTGDLTGNKQGYLGEHASGAATNTASTSHSSTLGNEYGSSGISSSTAPIHHQQDDTIRQSSLATDSGAPEGYSRDRLSSVHEPRTSISSDPAAPLASTEGPFQQPTTDDVSKSEAPLTSSVSSQNAPGKAGAFGENVLSAFGYGGAHVERPKEEQGIGEKIVNFLGA